MLFFGCVDQVSAQTGDTARAAAFPEEIASACDESVRLSTQCGRHPRGNQGTASRISDTDSVWQHVPDHRPDRGTARTGAAVQRTRRGQCRATRIHRARDIRRGKTPAFRPPRSDTSRAKPAQRPMTVLCVCTCRARAAVAASKHGGRPTQPERAVRLAFALAEEGLIGREAALAHVSDKQPGSRQHRT